MHNEADEE